MHRSLLLYDVAAVFVFVVAGRANHGADETATGIFHTAGPFLIALGGAWLITRAWRNPRSLPTGGTVAAITVIGGLILRRSLFDDGTDPSFVLVAAAVLTLLLLGWRLGARVLSRHRSPASL